MMELKRRHESLDHSSHLCNTVKRHKTQGSLSIRERKEKLGEKIAALQQLVSPFGKTDTASVLLEAMGYIKFLQEQVQVLSAPYLQSTPTGKHQPIGLFDLENSCWKNLGNATNATTENHLNFLSKVPESEYNNLRSRGLCLVPVGWTLTIARSNGADIWAPVMTNPSK